ncbi:MAG: hypothetical protein ACK47B_27145 [Armatimonadota bacterium]
MPISTEVRLFNSAGERQPLPDRYVVDWSFELLDRGGCGTFTLQLHAELDDQELPALPGVNWRVEFWFDGVNIYRGWVEKPRGPVQVGAPLFVLDGVGRMGWCQSLLVDCRYVRPFGADVSEIYAWLAGKFLTGDERIPELVVACDDTIGYSLETADFFGANAQEAFDRMAEASQDLLIWGFDVTPEGTDRLYVRSRPLGVSNEDYRFRVGKDVTFYEQPEDLSELVNAVRFIGGKAKAPNLVYNPSFELPKVAGEGASGNLLSNPGFAFTGGWTFTPSVADIRQQNEGEKNEQSRRGGWFAELDDPGDQIEQTVDVPNGENPYILSFWHALQQAGSGKVRVKLQALNSSNVVIETLINELVDVTATRYQEFRRVEDATDPNTDKLRVTISYDSGGSCHIDDVALYEADALAQAGWMDKTSGSAKGRIDWANMESPYHGVYCVRARVRSIADPSNDHVRLMPFKGQWIAVRSATSYVVRVRVRGAAGLKLKLGLQRWKEEGGSDYQFGDVETLAGTGDWETFQTTVTTGDEARNIRPIIELRSNGVYYLDAVQVFESGIGGTARFFDGESLHFYFRSDDPKVSRADLAMHASDPLKVSSAGTPFTADDIGKLLRITGGAGWTAGDYRITDYTSGGYAKLTSSPAAAGASGGQGDCAVLLDLSDDARASIATYGLREAEVSIEEIETYEQALDYATGCLNRYAVPARQGRLVLEPCDVPVRFVGATADAPAQGMLAVGGARVELPAQHPVRIFYQLQPNGVLSCEVELTNRTPDEALLLFKALRSGGGSGGGSGGAGVNLRAAPGNTNSGGEEGATLSHASLTDVTANQHHHQVHGFVGADHSVASTEGYLPVVQSGGASLAMEPAGTHLVLSGLLAAMPASAPAGTIYLATDDGGGTSYRYSGSVWVQMGAGVTDAGGAPYLAVPILAPENAVTWANMPAAVTELLGATRHRTFCNLESFTQARLVVNLQTAGALGARLKAQYSLDASTWADLASDGDGPALSIGATGTAYALSAPWETLATAARADVYLRVVGVDGDAAADPAFGLIMLQFR